MATKIEIVNLALTLFGQRRLASLTAANETARIINTIYTPTLLEVLEARDWSFARKQSVLSLLSEVDADGVQPFQGYNYLYAIPNLCVKVRKVFEDGGANVSEQDRSQKQNFEEVVHPESGVTVIASDVEDAFSHFTSRIEDPTQFSPTFVKAFAAGLASVAALPITQDKAIAASMANLYQMSLPEASRINAGRENPKKTRTSGYIDCR